MPPQLRPKCLAYFLEHGVAGLSLRPLAVAVGTSARMLIHHFGSKEELIGAVMGDVRDRFQEMLQSIEAQNHSRASDVMVAFWQRASSSGNLPYLRLLLEVQVLATQRPKQYRAYLRTTSKSWLTLVAAAVPASKDRAADATLCTAVIDGLLLELLSTGDRRRTTRALELFVRLLNSKQMLRRRAIAR